jgi:hypothetical protein
MVSCTLSNERRTLTMRTESIGRMSSPGAVAGSDKPRRLCIVARDPLKCGEFVDALQMSIDPDEEIEIIVDRRRSQPGEESEPDDADAPSIDRRRHQHLDVMLQMNGFFIVPGSVTVPAGSLTLDSEEDRRRLESILDFESQRDDRRRPWWILAGLVGLGGLIAATLAFLPAAKTLVSRPRLEPPPPADRTETIVGQVQTPPVIETPSPPANVAAPAPTREVAPVPSREVASVPSREVTPVPSREVTPAPRTESSTPTTASPEIPARPDAVRSAEVRDAAPKRDAEAPPRATVAQPREVSPPTVSEPPQTPQRRELTSVRFPGLPRVELVRRPVPGRGSEEYAVRVSDATGRPVSGAEVSLILTLASGTVLDIPLASGAEPGMYHGTAPPDRAVPTNLRVRVVTTDKRIEVPLAR